VSWARGTSLRVRIAAAVATAAVIAAVVVVVLPSSPPPDYASLPAPCGGISLASLTTLLPHPTGSRQSVSAENALRQESCKWSSTAGSQDQTLQSDVALFTSSTANSEARQSYDSALGALACRCAGTSVSTRSVTGLGDRAVALFVTLGPGAQDLSSVSGGPFPGITLLVMSRNAEIFLSYNVTVTATATPLAATADAALLTDIVGMARGVLAALARTAAVSPGALAPVSAEPHYAGSRDPCRLIDPATIARYAPGATISVISPPDATKNPFGAQMSSCDWGSGGNLSILLNLSVFPDAVSARQGFDAEAQTLSRTGSAITVTGSRWQTNLGEQAAAIYQTRSAAHGVEVFVWSGNIELDYWFTPVTSLDRATLLAAGVAIARDGLAALASRSASSYPQGPVYASPHDACKLIKASTLARYAPGASVDTVPVAIGGPFQVSNCAWGAPDGTLFLDVTTYSDADAALGGYQSDTQNARQNQNGNRFNGSQPVKGLGDQATAIFETSLGYPEVDLYVLLGNAQVEMTFADLPFSPTLSRDEKLAADIAMIRDVLAGLPRT
jgi:hypothetical protein